MCIKAVTTALGGLDGVQSVSVKKGATSTITMKPGKVLTKEAAQKALSAIQEDSPYKITAWAEAKAAEDAADEKDKKKSDEKPAK